MTTSYSVLLLEALNPNLSVYSMSIPSGEVRIRPAPLPCAFEAPSFYCSFRLVSDVELAQLCGPHHHPSGGLWFM